ncbi:hypothetical protein NKW44_09160 [Acetobacter lovaniensis]|uniref:hypothetical protein n=1 Tax=Acetobacter lovaniensis TaxID=104100 RepID=UPI00209CB817|nr:hypothetical protein [Acetobacter lovaniensis]MCP1239862.1 hypothetical protein [Acetobacter lovaniensis]
MSNLVHNERVKARAALLNSAAGSCLTLGLLAPIAAAFFSHNMDTLPVKNIESGFVVWSVVAFMLHKQAIKVLGGLKDD